MRNWCASSVRSVLRVVRMPGPARCSLVEAALWLGIARLCVLVLPYRWVVIVLSLRDRVDGPSAAAETEEAIARVIWAVATAARHTPWESNCLARAIAAKVMLRRRRIGSTLSLGVRRDSEALTAHAWLSRDRSPLVGGAEAFRYAVVWTSEGGGQ